MNINSKKVKAGLAVAIATAASSSLIATPQAQAYGGVEDPGTGIVWGVEQDGTYMIPLKEGGEVEGFCIDAGAAYPKQNGGTLYGPPVPYGSGLDAASKKIMIVSLLVGKAAAENGPMVNQIINFIKTFAPQVNDLNADTIVAGASGAIHRIGDLNTAEGGSGGANWGDGADRLPGGARLVYDTINSVAPMIPDVALDMAGVDLFVRIPEAPGYQRMISMSDIRLPEFNFDLGSIEFPTPTDENTPPTPSSELPTPTTTPSGTTPQVTPPVTTPSTTARVSSKRTTPRPTEEEKTPSVRTSAGSKEGNLVEVGKSITDTVTYDNLKPGTKYKLVAETADKETGSLLGNTGELEFTPESSRGSVDVDIPIQVAGSSELVVFETLYEITDNGEKKVAEHRDLNDLAQTVGKPQYAPEIRTLASASTGNVIQSGTTVDDQVSYAGLEPGKEYRLEARLMDKVTGADTGASQTITFTPAETAGTVTVSGIVVTNPDSTQQVVFERLYDAATNTLVASHEDITDAAQTVGSPAEELYGEKGKLAKKKVAPEEKPTEAPVMIQNQEANPVANAGGPAGTGGGGAPARPVIASVPSGETSGYGSTIFNR